MAGIGMSHPCDLLGRALRNNFAAPVTAFRPQVNHPVRGLDHIQVVLDNHNRVAMIAQAVKNGQ